MLRATVSAKFARAIFFFLIPKVDRHPFFHLVPVLGPPTLPMQASEETVPFERTQLNVTRFFLHNSFHY